MKKFLAIILSALMSLGVVVKCKADDSSTYGISPERQVQTSQTFRAGAGMSQSYYMQTTVDSYVNYTELVDYKGYQHITFGYSLTKEPVTKKAMSSGDRDRYSQSGTLRYAFGGPIDGWEMYVFTEHYYR